MSSQLELSLGSGGASMSVSNAAAARDDLALAGWDPLQGSGDSDLLPELDTLMSRSRDLARNNGLMAGGVQTLKDNIVGAVCRLVANPDYRLLGWDVTKAREWGNATEAKFRSWAETTECDAGRTLNLQGLTIQALGASMTNGDALALPMWLPRPDSRWSTRLMAVESDRLDTPVEMRGRYNIRKGIEFDDYGAPTAYYILKHHPGDLLAGLGSYPFNPLMVWPNWERVPAFTEWGRRRVIHLHDKERAGQSRGKPIVAAVMREFHMAGKYSANELEASVAQSLVMAALESDLDPNSAAALFGEKPREEWNKSVKSAQGIRRLKGAAVIPLPIGAKLNGFAPSRPNQAFEAFMLAVLRHIAAGLNIPYELLVKDFSKTNYSSARAALLEAWRYFNGRRRWLVDYWLKPIYELWLEEAVNAGEIEAPDFYENRYAYTRCRFIFGGKGWVDPVKEAQAAVLRVAAGFSTLEQECAEQGLDYEEVLDQRMVERQMMVERGLNPDGATAATASAGVSKSLDDKEGTEDGTNSANADAEALKSSMSLIREGALA